MLTSFLVKPHLETISEGKSVRLALLPQFVVGMRHIVILID